MLGYKLGKLHGVNSSCDEQLLCDYEIKPHIERHGTYFPPLLDK